jgi:sugar phosphate isomerase/epimerase
MFQLGFTSAIVPELSFDQLFALAGRIGYDCIEVMCWPPSKAERRYSGITHIDISQIDDSLIESVQKTCETTGVAISALGYYPNALSPDKSDSETAVKHLKDLIAAAPKFGVQTVNTFIGRDYTLSVDANWPRLLETWKPILTVAAEHNVKIGIENCPMLFGADEWPGGKNIATTPAIWTRLFNDLDSESLGLNYDPSHMVWQHMCYLEPIRKFSDKFFHAHAKDVRIDRERLNQVGILAHPNDYHTPKLPGMGEVDWGMFFSELTDSQYRGPVCVEVEDRAYEASDDLRELALRQSHTYLRNFIPKT